MLSEASNGLIGQIGRFSIAGVINTALGYVVIFGGMALGLSPYASNFLGYLSGFFCSFFLGRRFVFLASGNSRRQLIRYFITFFIAYFLNLGTLYFCLQLSLNNLVSQIFAGASYLIVMFAFSRIWVFK